MIWGAAVVYAIGAGFTYKIVAQKDSLLHYHDNGFYVFVGAIWPLVVGVYTVASPFLLGAYVARKFHKGDEDEEPEVSEVLCPGCRQKMSDGPHR